MTESKSNIEEYFIGSAAWMAEKKAKKQIFEDYKEQEKLGILKEKEALKEQNDSLNEQNKHLFGLLKETQKRNLELEKENVDLRSRLGGNSGSEEEEVLKKEKRVYKFGFSGSPKRGRVVLKDAISSQTALDKVPAIPLRKELRRRDIIGEPDPKEYETASSSATDSSDLSSEVEEEEGEEV